MNLKIKICGLKTLDAIDAAQQNGADYIGFIFFEKSPRNLTIDAAQKLRPFVSAPTKLVAVTVDASDTLLDDIVAHVKPDMLQLHGHETPARVEAIKARYKLPIIKAFSIKTADDFAQVKPYYGIADDFLFDAKAPEGALLPGGNGISFDWSLLDQLDKDVPYLLSGGLNADNIGAALAVKRLQGVDISSGIETTLGVKDINLINHFFEAIKKAWIKQVKQGD